MNNEELIATIVNILKENPDVGVVLTHETIEKYKPLVYGVGKELLSLLHDYAFCEELHDINAAMDMNRYQAYIKQGFTEEQAFTLLLRDKVNLTESLKSGSNNISRISEKKE